MNECYNKEEMKQFISILQGEAMPHKSIRKSFEGDSENVG